MIHELNGQYRHVVLSPIEDRDMEDLRNLRNKERSWFIYSDQINSDAQMKWYNSYKMKDNDFMFKIEHIDFKHKFIGAVALYNCDNFNAEFGRLLIDREKTETKGLGYEATVCACQIGFEKLNLRRIYLEVFSDNKRAISCYYKAGFVETDRKTINDREIINMELINTKKNIKWQFYV